MLHEPRKASSQRCGSPQRTLVLGIVLAAGTAACGGQLGDDKYGTSAQALTGSDAVARGEEWVAAMVPYCQSPNGQSDPDPSCSAVCMRPMESAWDPYRSDCSGFVSWAWDLPAPGRTTDEFAPAVTDITSVIDGLALQPGDALNIPGDHMVLFVSWITPGQNANFMEEPGCSADPPYAHAFTSDVTISGSSVTIAYEGETFTAIRYTALTGQGDAGTVTVADAGISCVVGSLGESGDCLLTSKCASLGGTSTPGYCPGANDIQCCTGIPMTMPGCSSNAQCSGTTPVCDVSTGACRACTSASDCSQGVCATSTSDPHAGSCVQCTANSDCASPDLCALSSDTCVQCLSDAQCPGQTPVCQSGACHACGTNADCAGSVHGPVCQTSGAAPGTCVMCTAADTAACEGATPVCDDALGSCVECLTDADCHSAAQPACNGATHTCACDSSDPGCETGADAGTTGEGSGAADAGTFVEPDAADAGTDRQAPGGCATGSSDLAMVGLVLGLVAMSRRSRRITA